MVISAAPWRETLSLTPLPVPPHQPPVAHAQQLCQRTSRREACFPTWLPYPLLSALSFPALSYPLINGAPDVPDNPLQALTRGISATPDLDLDVEQEGHEGEEQEDAATPLAPDHTEAETDATARSAEAGGGGAGTNVYANVGAATAANPESRPPPQQRQQQQESWASGGRAAGDGQRRRRRLDGNKGDGDGGDGGAGRLRGSSPREEFVHAGKQGKPLHDKVSFRRRCDFFFPRKIDAFVDSGGKRSSVSLYGRPG